MATLDTFSSNKTQILETLFPNGTWKDLLRELVWELYERLPKDEVVLRLERRIFGIPLSFELKWYHIATALVKLVGPRQQ